MADNDLSARLDYHGMIENSPALRALTEYFLSDVAREDTSIIFIDVNSPSRGAHIEYVVMDDIVKE